eukprot:1539723-Prymnesium_polylepis.1
MSDGSELEATSSERPHTMRRSPLALSIVVVRGSSDVIATARPRCGRVPRAMDMAAPRPDGGAE